MDILLALHIVVFFFLVALFFRFSPHTRWSDQSRCQVELWITVDTLVIIWAEGPFVCISVLKSFIKIFWTTEILLSIHLMWSVVGSGTRVPQSLLYLMKTLTENLELNLTFSSWLNRKKKTNIGNSYLSVSESRQVSTIQTELVNNFPLHQNW